jgi:hypothetical protein
VEDVGDFFVLDPGFTWNSTGRFCWKSVCLPAGAESGRAAGRRSRVAVGIPDQSTGWSSSMYVSVISRTGPHRQKCSGGCPGACV